MVLQESGKMKPSEVAAEFHVSFPSATPQTPEISSAHMPQFHRYNQVNFEIIMHISTCLGKKTTTTKTQHKQIKQTLQIK